jgi:hypothetical protein
VPKNSIERVESDLGMEKKKRTSNRGRFPRNCGLQFPNRRTGELYGPVLVSTTSKQRGVGTLSYGVELVDNKNR